MSLSKDRLRAGSAGLGTLQVLQLEPTPDTEFSDAGYLKNTVLNDASDMVELVPETGVTADYLEQKKTVSGNTMLMQTGIDEINLVKTAGGSAPKLWAMRYFGMTRSGGGKFQLYTFPYARINPGVQLQFASGERGLPLAWQALKNLTLAYDVPEYLVAQGESQMYYDRLHLFVDPRHETNLSLAQILDASGWSRHGTITSDFATIWSNALTPSPTRMLRFDGVNDAVDFGDVLDDDGTSDIGIEMWIRVTAADGTIQELLSKKSAISGVGLGYAFSRNASNQIVFVLSDASTSAAQSTTGTVLQNTWKHIAVGIDRNGNGQIYLNGAASGSPVSVSPVGSGANAFGFRLASDGAAANFGQFDCGAVRFHKYGAGNLPADFAARMLAHYNAEKTYYGL